MPTLRHAKTSGIRRLLLNAPERAERADRARLHNRRATCQVEKLLPVP